MPIGESHTKEILYIKFGRYFKWCSGLAPLTPIQETIIVPSVEKIHNNMVGYLFGKNPRNIDCR